MAKAKKKKKIRVKDIAEILNISTSSVSRALNNHPRISQKTKDKVKKVALELGYNPAAPELILPKKSKTILVLLPTIDDAVYRRISVGVSDILNEKGYQTFLLDYYQSDETITSLFKNYQNYGISGVIHIVGNTKSKKNLYTIPIKDSLPIVAVFEPKKNTAISTVMPDLYEGVYKISQYFKSNSISRVTLILEDETRADDSQLLTSFENSMDLDEFSEISFSVINFSSISLETELSTLLSQKNRPEVLIVKNPHIASFVERIVNKLGLEIPKDLLLIAIGVDSLAIDLPPNLSLLNLPAKKMGEAAAELIIEQISSKDNIKKMIVAPVHFILKGSAIVTK